MIEGEAIEAALQLIGEVLGFVVARSDAANVQPFPAEPLTEAEKELAHAIQVRRGIPAVAAAELVLWLRSQKPDDRHR